MKTIYLAGGCFWGMQMFFDQFSFVKETRVGYANGFVEMFRQGDQEPYERERPVARQYQQMNKNYQSIIKQLTDLLPKEVAKKAESDGFDDFVNRRA